MSSLMQPLTMFLGNVQYVLVAVVGGMRVASGAISVGEVQAFIQYSRTFSMPLTQLASMMNVFQSGIASLERVLDLLDTEEQIARSRRQRADAADPGPGGLRGRVVLLRPRPPAHRAPRPWWPSPARPSPSSGPTGAGKTTLVNLIMRFYELDDGRITLDGRDISQIPRRALREHLGMVLQDTWLFGGTIRDNIAYGRPGATEEEILDAARATYVDRFVHHLPLGYDTVIDEEGDNISAGQKQLLTIARAFLSQPAILILDEATSSVDTRTEVLIQEAMNALRADRTSFVIAHRLSTIRGADVILVMEDGRIVEQGIARRAPVARRPVLPPLQLPVRGPGHRGATRARSSSRAADDAVEVVGGVVEHAAERRDGDVAGLDGAAVGVARGARAGRPTPCARRRRRRGPPSA